MAEFTPFKKLYKWKSNDTKRTTINEMYNNAQKIEDALVSVDAQLADNANHRNDIATDIAKAVGYRHKINVEDLLKIAPINSLQGVFNAIPNNTELHFSKLYEISSELVLSKSGIKLVGDIAPTYGNGAGIKNIGTGNALRITGSKFETEQFCVHGTGDVYNFGAGATGQHGIVFDGSTVWYLNRCQIIGHGGHGIFTTNGVWNCRINQCLIAGNALDGVNSQSTGTAGNQQNGNNVTITQSIIGSNGGNGINWRATQLSVNDNDISANKGAGLLVDFTGASAIVGGIDFRGNYVENNKNGQIMVISTSTYGLKYMIVEGNYFNASYEGSGPTALIVFSGTINKNNYIDIGNNNYSTLGTYVVNYVDGGNTFTETCSVYRTNTSSAFVNLGLAKLNIAGIKTRVVNGLSNQKALAWSTPQKSDNAYTNGIDTYFSLPVTEGEILQYASVYVETDATSSYNVSLILYEKDETGSQTWASIGSAAPTFSSGGSNKANYNIASTSTIRVKQGKTYFLRVIIPKPATGTTLYLHNLNLSVI